MAIPRLLPGHGKQYPHYKSEKAAGWKLLFNGKNFDGWHNFRQDGVRPG